VKFLDANIFLRYLVADDNSKSGACLALFKAVQRGDEAVTTSESVIAEVAYVLRSKAHYGLAPAEISARLRPLINLRALKLPHKRSFLRAFDLWDDHPALDFEDALSIAHMERLNVEVIFSYDKDFDAVDGVTRAEP
jgi:predicted nucleic acid-binding protein